MQIIGYTPIQGEGITQEHECQKVEFIAAALMAVYHRLQLKFFWLQIQGAFRWITLLALGTSTMSTYLKVYFPNIG